MHNSDPTPQGVENRNTLLWYNIIIYEKKNSRVAIVKKKYGCDRLP
jgi:hypothetical protein